MTLSNQDGLLLCIFSVTSHEDVNVTKVMKLFLDKGINENYTNNKGWNTFEATAKKLTSVMSLIAAHHK